MRRLQTRGLTDSYHLLTDREKEVLQLLAEGRSNKEVATLLDLGLSTVETHRANLMQKLNLHNTAVAPATSPPAIATPWASCSSSPSCSLKPTGLFAQKERIG